MPTVTSELEIFDRLSENLRRASEKCAVLAWHPRRGFEYDDFRKAIALARGCCRQIYYWRNYDSQWLPLVQMLTFIHQRAGNWLRNSPTAAMRKKAQPEFKWLSEKLAYMAEQTGKLRHRATFRVGPILPEERPDPTLRHKPVQVLIPEGFRVRDSGLIVPT